MPGALRLHPSVELKATAAAGFELHDTRTDFRLAFDDVAPPANRGAELDGDLGHLCDELGLLDVDLTEAEVRRRQRRFSESQSWEERLERFRALLAFAIEKVPYYRDRSSTYAPDLIDAPGDLHKLPVLKKGDVRAAFMQLCAEDIDVPAETQSGRLELVATSGTTDERLQALSDATLVRIPANYDAIFGIERVVGVPRTAVLTSVTCLAQGCTLTPDAPASHLVHDYTLYLPTVRDPFAFGRDDVRAIADEMAKFEPAFLFVNPIYAHLLARRAAELGIALPPVRLVISCYQYLSNLQRRALTDFFGAPVQNLYAATELGGCQLGLECHRGRLHVREDHCLVEIVAGTNAVAPGSTGALVVSTLASTTMPLVRYAVGDLGEPSDAPCDCPLSDWPSILLHGRERDALYVGGRFVTTRQLDTIVGLEPGIDFYCCRQVNDTNLIIEVVPSLGQTIHAPTLVDRIEQSIPGASVEVRLQKRLEPAPSFKYPLTSREIAAPSWIG